MEKAYNLALRNGWKYANLDGEPSIKVYEIYVCDPLFWKALHKAISHDPKNDELVENWVKIALRFHEINLTQNWDAAVKYLEELISK